MTHSARQFLSLYLIVFTLSACSTRMMTPEEIAIMSSKTYQTASPKTILLAVSDLFFLADDLVFQRTLSPDHLMVVRNHGLDLGLTLVQAKDTWTVSTQPGVQGTTVTLDIKSEESWATGRTRVQTPNGPAVYEQFWNRLDYLLGQSPTWMSCRDLNHAYLEDRTWGDVWWLCGELQDRIPPELLTGTWQKAEDIELSPEDQQHCMDKVSAGSYGIAESKRQQAVYFSVCLEEEGYRLVEKRPATD